MTKPDIAELADLAIKHSLFEPLEPAIVVECEGEPRQVVIPHAFIHKFAELILQECVRLCEWNAEDVDNGNVFINDRHRLDNYRLRFSTGSLECAELINHLLEKPA